jgi:hypothetical protein
LIIINQAQNNTIAVNETTEKPKNSMAYEAIELRDKN